MGVVYKLKKEIVDFIINRKKEDPSLSCRKLVNVVAHAFGIKLSKSSINAILKNAFLSSPIGRRAQEDSRPSKFQIPEEKKKNLFVVGKPAPSQSGKSKAQKIKMALPPDKDTKIKEKKIATETLGKTAKMLPHAKGKTSQGKVVLQVPRESPQRDLYDGMGAIFLKAAEWELSDKPIVGKLLDGHIKGGEIMSLDKIGEILLFMEVFGASDIQGLFQYNGQGLWLLNGLKERLPKDSFLAVFDNFRDLGGLEIKYSIEIPQIFTELSCFRLILEDGTSLSIDAQMTMLLGENVQTGLSIPLSKAVKTIVKELLNNVQSAILCCSGSENFLSREFFDLYLAFENCAGKRIVKIAGIDQNNQEIASFVSVFRKKRTFICGLWPWQKEFKEIIKNIKDNKKDEFCLEIGPKRVFFSEISADILNNTNNGFQELTPLRIFMLRDETKPLAGIITNSAENKAAEQIIIDYVKRWPNLAEGMNIERIKTKGKIPVKSMSFSQELTPEFFELKDVFTAILSLLNNYCLRHYFGELNGDVDITSMISMFYSLPGGIKTEKGMINVHLRAPEGYQYTKELQRAVKKINESCVCDFEGRKLLLNVSI